MAGFASFGGWLKHQRRALGLTQEELARLVYCAPITLRKIENDQLRPSRELACSIVETIGVAPEERDMLVHWARARREPLFAQVMGHLAGMYPSPD